jgi:serine/threonine-protein kinase RsbW
MVHQQSDCRAVPPLSARRPGDFAHEAVVHTLEEMTPLLNAVRAAMTAAGYSERDQFGVELSLEEAITNGHKHGNRGDKCKHVHVSWEVNEHRALIAVEDQGTGFDPALVPDPREPENLMRTSGRGLLLMSHFLSWVRFNECGNRVTLCQVRTV